MYRLRWTDVQAFTEQAALKAKLSSVRTRIMFFQQELHKAYVLVQYGRTGGQQSTLRVGSLTAVYTARPPKARL